MESGLINFEQLKEFTGYSEPHQVRKWLDDNKIKQFPCPGKRGRPCTTLKAVNAALGLESEQAGEAPIRRVEL